MADGSLESCGGLGNSHNLNRALCIVWILAQSPNPVSTYVILLHGMRTDIDTQAG